MSSGGKQVAELDGTPLLPLLHSTNSSGFLHFRSDLLLSASHAVVGTFSCVLNFICFVLCEKLSLHPQGSEGA